MGGVADESIFNGLREVGINSSVERASNVENFLKGTNWIGGAAKLLFRL